MKTVNDRYLLATAALEYLEAALVKDSRLRPEERRFVRERRAEVKEIRQLLAGSQRRWMSEIEGEVKT